MIRRKIPFIFIMFIALRSGGQNIYEISITSFADRKYLRDVTFELYQEQNKLVEQVSANGLFQFVIVEGDQPYRLKASKEDYVPKIIHFDSRAYPYLNEYEIQEIDIEFRPKTSEMAEPEVGELKWSSIGHVFNVVKVDSSMVYVKENYAKSERALGQIYATSIERADEFTSIGKEEYALPLFEIALMSKPNDSYSKRRILEIKRNQLEPSRKEKDAVAETKEILDRINRGETGDIPENLTIEDAIFSVQIGAFSGKVDRKAFDNVPDVNIIEYEDYTRVFSGSYYNIEQALDHKNDLIKLGYKDGWIVQMKDNKRIGF